MRRELLCGAAALAITAAISGPVLAADLPTKGRFLSPAPAFNWTGFYVGLHAGVGTGRWDFGAIHSEPFQFANGTAVLAGGHLGYNWQAPGSNIVWGVEGDISSAWILSANVNRSRRNSSIDMLASLRGRLGIAMDRVLFFGTAGFGWVSGKNFASHDNALLGSPENFSHTAWVVGAGVEWAATQNVFLRMESLYYGVNKLSSDPTTNRTPDGELTLLKDVWTVRVGASVRF